MAAAQLLCALSLLPSAESISKAISVASHPVWDVCRNSGGAEPGFSLIPITATPQDGSSSHSAQGCPKFSFPALQDLPHMG